MKTHYLDEQALINLKNYKYVAGEYSTMDHMLTPFWNKLVTYLPMWMAPNMVTLIALGFQVSTLLHFLTLDLSLEKNFQSELYIWSAFSLFMYQTLDAIDGKQARRTGSSSPLGQLFDHGCDALQSCIIYYLSCQIWKCPPTELSFYMLMFSILGVFFCANWEEYHVGILRTSQKVGNLHIGLTECQFILMFSMFVEAASFGQFSQIKIRHIGNLFMPQMTEQQVQTKMQYLLNSTAIQQKEFFENVQNFGETRLLAFYVVLSIIPTIIGIVGNFTTVFSQTRHSTLHAVEGLLPLFMSAIFVWSSLSFSDVAWTKPIYMLCPMFFFFSLNCSRVIIATVTKQEYSIFKDFHLTVPVICGILSIPLNQAFDWWPEENLFSALIVVNMFVYFWYITHVIQQITSYLGIYCFTIKKKVD